MASGTVKKFDSDKVSSSFFRDTKSRLFSDNAGPLKIPFRDQHTPSRRGSIAVLLVSPKLCEGEKACRNYFLY